MTAIPGFLTPIVLPMPVTLGAVNVYLVRGPGGAALVDTGMDDAASRAALAAALAAHGLALGEQRGVEGRVQVHLLWAQALLERRDAGAAAEHIEWALATACAPKTAHCYFEIWGRRLKARWALELGQHAEAEAQIGRSLALAGETGNLLQLGHGQRVAAEICAAQGALDVVAQGAEQVARGGGGQQEFGRDRSSGGRGPAVGPAERSRATRRTSASVSSIITR